MTEIAVLLFVAMLAASSPDCRVSDLPCSAFEASDLARISTEAVQKLNERWDAEAAHLTNQRYLTLFDVSAHSGTRRFYVIDRERKTIEKYLVAHGRGSDPDHDGLATSFGDVPGSKKTPLGFFITAETYTGRHGHSLKLDGLDARNRQARFRAIVIHGADYVSEGRSVMGRSWGCPALDTSVAVDVIERIKGGSLLYIYEG